MAAFVVLTGVAPSEYPALTVLERAALVERARQLRGKG